MRATTQDVEQAKKPIPNWQLETRMQKHPQTQRHKEGKSNKRAVALRAEGTVHCKSRKLQPIHLIYQFHHLLNKTKHCVAFEH
jgi:hypothetical protein